MSSATFLRRLSRCYATPTQLTKTIRCDATHSHLRYASSKPQYQDPIDVISNLNYEELVHNADSFGSAEDPDAIKHDNLEEFDRRYRRIVYRGKPRGETPKWSDPLSSPSLHSGSPFVVEDHAEDHLPTLPEKPKYPCPHLSDEEVEQYLFPLYGRLWSLTRCDIEWNGATRRPFMLSKTMTFPSLSLVMDYLKDFQKVIEEEEHHPKITIDGTKLTISTHTHSATIPGMVFKDKTSPYRKFPGITLRDVRLAIEAEVLLERRMFMDSSIAPVPNPSGQCPVTILEVSGYRIPSSTTSFPNEEDEPSPSDIDDVLSTLPLHTFVGVESHIAAIPDVTGSWSIRIWKGEAIDRPINKLKCQACGGKHALATCTQRHRYPPKGVCKLCEGSHWLIDCPLYVRRKPKLPGY